MVMPMAIEWNDVESWESIAKIQSVSDKDNYAIGDILLEDVSNSCVRAESRLVMALGIHDQIVVETADAVLVADRSQAQEVHNWIVVSGTAEVERAGGVQRVAQNESIHIPAGEARRLRNPGISPLELIEVQTGGRTVADSDRTEGGKLAGEDKKTA